MAKTPAPRAQSLYKGLRVTLTQPPGDGPSFLTLSAKLPAGHWDDWNLLFPAIRIPQQPINDYRDVLVVVVKAVEALLAAEEGSR